ncbi:MAG: tetraacyldisaccharide 4'-kinase, partial [Myxococcales bacterium]|nr:tetraacyldisaccharide 4'-kinase [Myxococcales bacterium]
GTHAVATPADLPAGLRAALGTTTTPPHDGLPALAAFLNGPLRPAPESSPRPWARPAARLHRARMARRARREPLPVVAVGSANARGAGKTTATLFVADGLVARGLRVAVVTRGTGATARGGDSRRHGPSAAHLGDEGAVLALAGHTVVAGPVEEALARVGPTDVVLLEDGLQRAPAVFSVAVVDARWPGARGPFPMGEGRALLRPSDVAIWVRASTMFPAPADAVLGTFVPERVPGMPCAAFAGIGRPADFFAIVPAVRTRSFADHHRYTMDDLRDLRRWAGDLPLVTTTRDAVRLPSRAGVSHVGVRLDVPAFPWSRLLEGLP